MEPEQLKRRILYTQFLTRGSADGKAPPTPQQVCRALNGVQAQYLSNAQHALRIRCGGALPADWSAGLAKSWTVRGTMHLFAESDLPLYLHAGRSHFLRPQDTMAGDAWVTAERKSQFAEVILDAIDHGNGEREALKATCAAAGMTETEAQSLFDPWGGLLRALAEQGSICYRVEEQKVYRRCPDFVPMEEAAACTEQLRRYFTHYGPAAVKDAAYFFAAPQTKVRQWMESLPLQQTAGQGGTAGKSEQPRYFLPLSAQPTEAALPSIPPCLFLAGFDPLLLGYEKTQSLFLPPEYLRGIFSLGGIVMPAVLLQGTVAARWKKTGKTKLTVSAFRELTAAEQRLVRETAVQIFPEIKKIEIVRL